MTTDIPLHPSKGSQFITIGERCNVAGSRKFLRLINEQKYDEALSIARQQVENGAHIIDLNFDDGMLNAQKEMTHFVNLIASEPEISRVPLMIDSSDWKVILSALKCIQGKSIVNSISLKEGEEYFLMQAKAIQRLGAAVVVMAFDEKGQADSYTRKIEICERAYRLLTEQIGFNPHDIIFDPNVLAIATGISDHDNYGVDFIEATRWIKTNLQHAKVSGGISNLSFAFRGNDLLREAMHTVFLYHAIAAGLDMGIVNAGGLPNYDEIQPDMLELIEEVILNKSSSAAERLTEFAQQMQSTTPKGGKPLHKDAWRESSLEERLTYALVKGIPDYLEVDLQEALAHYPSPLTIIEQPLMSGMTRVGELFGKGKMFLPQVVKTARTMKLAVAFLEPHIQKEQRSTVNRKAGKILIATVKGDVHDIGKNIVSVILACNNYEVIDLGVMVPREQIVETAIKEQVDIIGLSGLITPSLHEMCEVATLLQERGVSVPLFIGGATTSAIHTAVKIAPLYHSPVVYVKDASVNVTIASQLLSKQQKEGFISGLRKQQQALASEHSQKQTPSLSYEEAQQKKPNLFV